MLKRLNNNPQLAQAPNTETGDINMANAPKPSHKGRQKSNDHPPLKATASPQFTIHIGDKKTPHAKIGNPVVGIRRNKNQRRADRNDSRVSELERANKKLKEEKQKLELQLKERDIDKIMDKMDKMSSTIEHLSTRIDLQEARETIREQADKISQLTKKIWQQKPM